MNSHIVRISSQGSHRITCDILALAKAWSVHTYVLLSTYSIEMQATRPLMNGCCTMRHSTTMLSVICKQIRAWACFFNKGH